MIIHVYNPGIFDVNNNIGYQLKAIATIKHNNTEMENILMLIPTCNFSAIPQISTMLKHL
jgi:hypothetical protein